MFCFQNSPPPDNNQPVEVIEILESDDKCSKNDCQAQPNKSVNDVLSQIRDDLPDSNHNGQSKPNLNQSSDATKECVTVGEARASSSMKENHSHQLKREAADLMCSKLGLDGLMQDSDIQSHSEFMDALYGYSVVYNEFEKDLLKYEQGATRQQKKITKIKSQLNECKASVDNVKTKLIEISSIKTSSGALDVRLKSCQQKMDEMMRTLPILNSAMDKLKKLRNPLKQNLRAQKQHQIKKVFNKPQVKLQCTNTLDLTWESAKQKISDMIIEGRHSAQGHTRAPPFSPLSGEQLILFCDIRESLYTPGNCCISLEKIQTQFDLTEEDAENAVHQILEHFPVLLVTVDKSDGMVLIDSHELAFQPNSVYDILSLDEEKTEVTADVYQSKTAIKEGIFFYRKPGPVPLQVSFKILILICYYK